MYSRMLKTFFINWFGTIYTFFIFFRWLLVLLPLEIPALAKNERGHFYWFLVSAVFGCLGCIIKKVRTRRIELAAEKYNQEVYKSNLKLGYIVISSLEVFPCLLKCCIGHKSLTPIYSILIPCMATIIILFIIFYGVKAFSVLTQDEFYTILLVFLPILFLSNSSEKAKACSLTLFYGFFVVPVFADLCLLWRFLSEIEEFSENLIQIENKIVVKSTELECKICLLNYSDTEENRRPKLFRACGHTVCQECAQKLLKWNRYVVCSFCQTWTKFYEDSKSIDLPDNIAIVEIIRKIREVKGF